jgi:N-acetylglucosaminyldiphosphoundecaprenol N-acetyl-beta-D-mannosaminyltransferase
MLLDQPPFGLAEDAQYPGTQPSAAFSVPPATSPLPQYPVLGIVSVHLGQDYLGWTRERLKQSMGTSVVTLNAEMTMAAERIEALQQAISRADLVIPDGAGVVKYLQMHRHRVQRCPGIELAEGMIQAADQLGVPVFFVGGAPGVAQKALDYWQHTFPTLQAAGCVDGFFSEAELPQILQRLADTQPGLILVGLGVPRQEFWIQRHRETCPRATWIGVGGSFDIWSGSKERAPRWFCENNLEWLYRLYQEPWRWRRMLDLPKFALRSLIYRVLP